MAPRAGSNDLDTKLTIRMIDLGTITTILVPLLYTAGWSFAYHYFEHFHLGMAGLNIQKEFLFLYSFWVIKDHLLFSVFMIVILVIVYFSIRLLLKYAITEREKKSVKRRYIIQIISLVFVPVIILASFLSFYHLGDGTADGLYKKQVESDFSSYPRVKIWLKKSVQKEIGPIADEWSEGCYRLLFRNKDHLYIFYAGGYSEKIATEVILQSDIQLLRILPLYQSSEKCRQ